MFSDGSHDAFLLLSLPNCTIRTPTSTQTGNLGLECVTLPPSAKATFDRDVFLVFRINELEIPIDPARTVSLNSTPTEREYVFYGTEADPLVFTLVLAESLYSIGPLVEDLETFESVLSQYVNFTTRRAETPPTPPNAQTSSVKNEELRGRLLLRDEDSGEIVGELDRKVMVKEDPSMYQRGHENDPVVIEIPEDASLTDHETAIEVFARSVPLDQHDWITKSATLASHAITGTTNLLVRVISTASSYYISHSTPSTSTQSSMTSLPKTGAPPPPPSRAAVFLSSDRTRKGLTKVHAVSATAVKVSSKTITFIDDVIYRVVGGKKGQATPLPPAQRSGNVYPSGPSTSLAPPPYSSTTNFGSDDKPPLPPRRSPSPLGQAGQAPPPPIPPRKLGTKARIVLSADLILSTIEESTKKIITIGADRTDAMVRHKYGPEAAQSSAAMAGTARNIGLVYVDLQGMGRKAIVKRVAKVYVKNKVLGSSK
ncbi:hypothetical protein L218DRAFT_120707 [Marasmius fiardii PR-910]|nr:hypothetical protein L218DRAFT_120707 [Marasmius fiardii PR-910]